MAENIKKHFQFLRNSTEFTSFDAAQNALSGLWLNASFASLNEVNSVVLLRN